MANDRASFQGLSASVQQALQSLIYNQQRDKAETQVGSDPADILTTILKSNPKLFSNVFLQNEMKGVQAQSPQFQQLNPSMDTLEKDMFGRVTKTTPGRENSSLDYKNRRLSYEQDRDRRNRDWREYISHRTDEKWFVQKKGEYEKRLQELGEEVTKYRSAPAADPQTKAYYEQLAKDVEETIAEVQSTYEFFANEAKRLAGGKKPGSKKPSGTPPPPVGESGDAQWIWDEASGALKPVK